MLSDNSLININFEVGPKKKKLRNESTFIQLNNQNQPSLTAKQMPDDDK